MPTASDAATTPTTPISQSSSADSDEAERTDGVDEQDDLGDRLRALSKCSPADAEQILDLLTDPQPLDEQAKATHEAGLARFATRFRIVDSR